VIDRLPLRPAVLAALLAAAMLAGLAPRPAAAYPTLVIDAETGRVLHAEEATRPWHPASTTKMMTAYLLLKAVREGRVALDAPFVASKRAAGQRPSKAGIRAGQSVTAEDALKLLMVKSANDIAVVIAENVGGSLEAFVRDMNAEARRLGMRSTRWTNANGWHDPAQQTSARDLAVLTRALWFEFPEYRGFWNIGSLDLNGRILKNTNGLVGRYPGVLGMKTGFVCASGFNLVSVAERGGRTLIGVVLGAGSGAERVVVSARLLDQAFATGGWGGGSGFTLSTLPASGFTEPPNMRQEVCGPGRKPFSLTEEESDAPVVFEAPRSVDPESPLGFLMSSNRREAAAAAAPRRSNTITLSERVLGPPVPVAFGPARPRRPARETPEPAPTPAAGAVAAAPEGEIGEPISLSGGDLGATPLPPRRGAIAPPPRRPQAAASREKAKAAERRRTPVKKSSSQKRTPPKKAPKRPAATN
jgi:D-alanyl-D-alanine carboxypeptidase